ncbi:hypothetical protein PL81_38690 [Streptomyces sp. RSD-27]|nr:hypothetical protein PL81_38690 [Streptomyces sp. RSD-27]
MALVIGEVKAGFLDGHPENGTTIPLPPQNGGAIGWGQVYVSLASDFGDALLRIAVWNGGSWRVEPPLKVASSAGRVTLAVRDGDQKISVGRLKADERDAGVCPVSYMIETTLKA